MDVSELMDRNDIIDRIRLIMSDVFDVDLNAGEITENTTAKDIEEWDSLSHIRLVVSVERKFGVKFSNSEIESLKTVGDLVSLLQAKTSA